MSVSLECSYCHKQFERKKVKKAIHHYCSQECQGRHSSDLRSDEYSMFRHMFGKAKSYAKRKYREFTITLQDIKDLWERQNGLCKLSGIKLKFGGTRQEKAHGVGTASLDRINSSYGYTPNNIQIIHKDLQDIKSDLPQEYFINWALLIADCQRGCMNDGFEPPILDGFSEPCYTTTVDDDDFPPF